MCLGHTKKNHLFTYHRELLWKSSEIRQRKYLKILISTLCIYKMSLLLSNTVELNWSNPYVTETIFLMACVHGHTCLFLQRSHILNYPFPHHVSQKSKHDLTNGQHNLKLGLSPTQFQKIWSWYLTQLIKLFDLIERKHS